MKINKETQALNDALDKMDLTDIYRTFHPKTTDIYRTFHPKTTEYTFFSSAHGTFSRIDRILGHKSSLGKFKKIDIVSSNFSNHNTMRSRYQLQEKNCKKYKHMEAKLYDTK